MIQRALLFLHRVENIIRRMYSCLFESVLILNSIDFYRKWETINAKHMFITNDIKNPNDRNLFLTELFQYWHISDSYVIDISIYLGIHNDSEKVAKQRSWIVKIKYVFHNPDKNLNIKFRLSVCIVYSLYSMFVVCRWSE